jgi:hypothetical protein
MQKHKFSVTRHDVFHEGPTSVPPQDKKKSVDISHLAHTRMHYVIRRSYQMLEHNFGMSCPDVLFVGSASGPPEHEK